MKYNIIIINIKSLSNTTCIPSHWRKRINIPCLQQNSISVQASRFQSLRDFFLTFEMWSPEPGTSWCSSPGRKPGSRAYEGRHTGSGDIWLGSGVSTPSWHQDDLLLLGSMMFPELLWPVFSVVETFESSSNGSLCLAKVPDSADHENLHNCTVATLPNCTEDFGFSHQATFFAAAILRSDTWNCKLAPTLLIWFSRPFSFYDIYCNS